MSDTPALGILRPTVRPAEPAATDATAVHRLQRRLWIERGIFAAVVLLLLGRPYLAGAIGPSRWSITVQGRALATLARKAEAERALALLRQELRLTPASFNEQVRLTAGGGGPRLPSAEAAAQALFPQLAGALPRGVIYVDRRPAVALPTELDAQDTLSEVKARRAAEIPNLETVPEFKQQVEVRRALAPPETWCGSIEEAVERLLTGRSSAGEGKTYVVQRGDLGGTIAAKHNLTLAELEALNPGVNWTRLRIGQQLRVSGHVTPVLTVQAVGREEKEIEIPYPIVRRPDPQLRRGQRKVVQEGQPGKDLCVYLIDYVNGKPVGPRRLERRERIVEPQPKIIHVGTRRRR